MRYVLIFGLLFVAGCANFFKQYPEPDSRLLERIWASTSSIHSGGNASYMVWRKDGYGLTAAHAFFRPNTIHTSFNGLDRYPVDLVGLDRISDVGVFRTRSKQWPNSKKTIEIDIARLGETVYVICYSTHNPPFIPGIIFSLASSLDVADSQYRNVIGFSFPHGAHMRGCSGGPLVNEQGRVIGMTQVAFIESGIGYATSIQEVIRIAQKLIDENKNP